jgi:hypothetical protein
MYPEGEGGAQPQPDYSYEEGVKSKLTRNLEGLIPLILIIIIAAFLGHKFGLWNIPFLGGAEPIQMLVIGQPSADLLVLLDQDKDILYYRVTDAAALNVSPEEQLAQYDIVLLDQHLGATAYEHSVSRQLGEALENFVRTGGKLIVVMDSGIYRSGPGNTVAADVVGWEANFGDIMPVKCEVGPKDKSSCETPFTIKGRIVRADFSHKIVKGIERAPASPELSAYAIKTFDVRIVGDTVAVIKDDSSTKTFPAIVEKKKLLGKVIYFNYEPGLTPGLFQNTLEYLR